MFSLLLNYLAAEIAYRLLFILAATTVRKKLVTTIALAIIVISSLSPKNHDCMHMLISMSQWITPKDGFFIWD